MPYTAEISRSNPTALLILIDQSYSMSEPFGSGYGPKATEAARVVNRVLTEFTIACAKGDDDIRDYFHIGVIGYGSSVGSAFGGVLSSSLLQPISKVGESPLRLDKVAQKVPDGAGGLVEQDAELPVWVEPVSSGSTPMCQALGQAQDALRSWVAQHSDAFPPTVLNITDGEVTDGNPEPVSSEIRAIETNDGPVLLFNCHITNSKTAQKTIFPVAAEGLSDTSSQQLFSMSSELPSKHLELARSEGIDVSTGSRGFVCNADLVDLTLFLEIGTRAMRESMITEPI